MLKRSMPSRLVDAASRQRGVSVVEMLVGVAVGMIIVVGGSALYISNLSNSRRILLETAVNQELRAAADLVSRDIRRAGYWGNAVQGTITVGASSLTTANPYSAVVVSGSQQLTYNFSRDGTGATESQHNALADAEQFGFRLVDGAIEMQTQRNSWTPITRTDVARVTTFTIVPTTTTINLGTRCSPQKAIGAPRYPTATVRSYSIQLVAQSASDSNVQRRLDSVVRLRNDELTGDCVTP